jgi:anaerobic ribonucleoside-triphosphate reductase
MNVIFKHGDITEISEEEKLAYMEYVKKKYPDEINETLIISFDDEGYANLEVHKHSVPFERIRRITGYLVGSLSRFNDGKRAEEHDRVKHGIK